MLLARCAAGKSMFANANIALRLVVEHRHHCLFEWDRRFGVLAQTAPLDCSNDNGNVAIAMQ